MQNRLYSLLTVTKAEDEQRIIVGVASTGETDRVGDIVEPEGATFRNPVTLLLGHDHSKPVGTVMFDQPTTRGIGFRAQLPKLSDPSPFRDRVEEAWASVRSGVIRGVSIAFRPISYDALPSGGRRFTAIELLELSLVAVPANASATITAVKRYAQGKQLEHRVVRIDQPIGEALHRKALELKANRPASPSAADNTVALATMVKTGFEAADEEIAALHDRIDRLEPRQEKSARLTAEQWAQIESTRLRHIELFGRDI
jgi:HK97 family phage prohead protease